MNMTYMTNRDIFSKDPAERKLVNRGVASVSDDATNAALDVLRYELETFVCDGQYEKGLERILENYLKNIDQVQQSGVWISGFYGSGKSHLVKMLRALWVDTKFSDGASARGIADLPQNIKDLLHELTTRAKQNSGLHAAAGTLAASDRGSTRLALLSIFFKSVGLPPRYPQACFVMYLKKNNIYAEIKDKLESKNLDWEDELDHLYVSEALHEALVQLKPNVYASPDTCAETLISMFPIVKDISSDEMIDTLRRTLEKDGKIPLTLIALDELQQYIGEDSRISLDVQEVVEACLKRIGGKLLFVATGQTAVTGTSNLKKLEGRFPIRIELTDSDVNAVIRKVILAKKPSAAESISRIMETNTGEISRHLAGTSLAHRQEDMRYFNADYPILPVRRRFWEHTLRVLDQTGTDSQLRNQLGMVLTAVQSILDKPLGYVIPADHLFFDTAEKMLQNYILPRKFYDKIKLWREGNEEDILKARASALVFLLNKLSSANKDIGIKATIDTIADLMVEDLEQGSGKLRGRLPQLLDNCEILMKIDNQYRMQTEESTAWNDDFQAQCSQLSNETHRLETERDNRIQQKFCDLVKKITFVHGDSKVNRTITPVFDPRLPPKADKQVYVWARTGWTDEESSVRMEARQTGNGDPTIFVFIPRRSTDPLRHSLIDYKAASAVLELRGQPVPGKDDEARAAMETTKKAADGEINRILDELFAEARVFQGGGNEINAPNLQEAVRKAAESSIIRLYPDFHRADQKGWDKVYTRAKQGAPDALSAAGYKGETTGHPVCKDIMAFIAAGKKGTEIREHFEAPPYGWPRDTIDGTVQVLLNDGLIHARDERYQPINPKNLERKHMGKASFKVETAAITATQRIEARKLMQRLKINAKSNEELAAIPHFIDQMQNLAQQAGGDPPKPQTPDTSFLDELRRIPGNEQLIRMVNRSQDIDAFIDRWKETAAKITQRLPAWHSIQRLLRQAGDLEAAQEDCHQVKIIENQRQLLQEPDPLAPLLKSLANTLRGQLNRLLELYSQRCSNLLAQLESEAPWQKLGQARQEDILNRCEITPPPAINTGTTDELAEALEQYPLSQWQDRIDALPGRCQRAREMAAKIMEPKTRPVQIPRRTISTPQDLDNWLDDVHHQLEKALQEGPVVIR